MMITLPDDAPKTLGEAFARINSVTAPTITDIKVMVLTSDSSRETVLAAIHAGADDYTIKTAFSRDEFRQKLDRLFRQPRDEFGLDYVMARAMSAPLSSEKVSPPGERSGSRSTCSTS